MIVTVFDYGAGNLHSLGKALDGPDREVRIEPDPELALETDVLVLPGVGAFGPAADALAPGVDALREALERGLPCIGICLGMQLLFESSDEGDGEGVGYFAGKVTRLDGTRVPQIGWNSLEDVTDPTLQTSGLTSAYFANGFACRPSNEGDAVAWATHERDRFAAAVRRGRTMGVQFHPEKSSAAGVAFLNAFLQAVAA